MLLWVCVMVGGHGVWMGVGCPCPPVRNNIVTPRHLFWFSRYMFADYRLHPRGQFFMSEDVSIFAVVPQLCIRQPPTDRPTDRLTWPLIEVWGRTKTFSYLNSFPLDYSKSCFAHLKSHTLELCNGRNSLACVCNLVASLENKKHGEESLWRNASYKEPTAKQKRSRWLRVRE